MHLTAVTVRRPSNPTISHSIDRSMVMLSTSNITFVDQWTCMIFNAYHRKRDANLFKIVRFLIQYCFKLLRYTCRIHYCWPVYYPHYSYYFLIVHAVFNADNTTIRKMMFLDYRTRHICYTRTSLRNKCYGTENDKSVKLKMAPFSKAVQFFLVFKCLKNCDANSGPLPRFISS